MNFHSLRSFLAALLLGSTAVLLSSCGGGAGSSPQGGPLIFVLPNTGTLYAGIPVTFQISGGRPPYTISSSEPTLLAVPPRVDGFTFTVLPANPGVIDTGLDPDELPVRTVRILVRDASNVDPGEANVQVAQNFLTHYGVSFGPLVCPGDPGEGAQACSGGTTAVRLQATFNGSLIGNRPLRFEVLRGNFALRNPATGQVSNSVVLTSDHTGTVTGIIEVPPGAPTQIAVLRVVDVATGVYADHVFVITQTSVTANPITAIPDTFTFTGALSTQCGTGRGSFFVFDGVPPYTALSSSPLITVFPTVSNSQPGTFTVEASNQDTCVDEATIVVTDAVGARDTVTVTTERGEEDPPAPTPPPALAVAPTSITLGCGQSGSVTVVGGTGSYAVNSTNPDVTATVSGRTVTITRAGPAGPGAGTATSTISITDGASIVTVTVSAPATCP